MCLSRLRHMALAVRPRGTLLRLAGRMKTATHVQGCHCNRCMPSRRQLSIKSSIHNPTPNKHTATTIHTKSAASAAAAATATASSPLIDNKGSKEGKEGKTETAEQQQPQQQQQETLKQEQKAEKEQDKDSGTKFPRLSTAIWSMVAGLVGTVAGLAMNAEMHEQVDKKQRQWAATRYKDYDQLLKILAPFATKYIDRLYQGCPKHWSEADRKKWLSSPEGKARLETVQAIIRSELVQANLTDWISYDGTVAQPWQQVVAHHPMVNEEVEFRPAFKEAMTRFWTYWHQSHLGRVTSQDTPVMMVDAECLGVSLINAPAFQVALLYGCMTPSPELKKYLPSTTFVDNYTLKMPETARFDVETIVFWLGHFSVLEKILANPETHLTPLEFGVLVKKITKIMDADMSDKGPPQRVFDGGRELDYNAIQTIWAAYATQISHLINYEVYENEYTPNGLEHDQSKRSGRTFFPPMHRDQFFIREQHEMLKKEAKKHVGAVMHPQLSAFVAGVSLDDQRHAEAKVKLEKTHNAKEDLLARFALESEILLQGKARAQAALDAVDASKKKYVAPVPLDEDNDDDFGGDENPYRHC